MTLQFDTHGRVVVPYGADVSVRRDALVEFVRKMSGDIPAAVLLCLLDGDMSGARVLSSDELSFLENAAALFAIEVHLTH